MNPPTPFFNPPFTFLPHDPNPNPNPNPNPKFPYSLPSSNSATQPLSAQSFLAPSIPNLHSTLTDLKHLIYLAETTLGSISNKVLTSKHLTLSNSEDFSSCPFNPNHRMPPESLFRHTLSCPSSPSAIDLTILDSLRYPTSVKSEAELRTDNSFVQSLEDTDAEVCFSIDEFNEFGSNFFYKDCPGVVCYPELDDTKSTFTLPRVLSVQCANFRSCGNDEIGNFPGEFSGILPSEVWALRNEIGSWVDYPHSYSFTVLRVLVGLWMSKESDSLKWIIRNSLPYGIVIDVPMTDHIFLLLKLCLKAISHEAHLSSKSIPIPLVIGCPVLVQVMGWLASQLSVLYGEANGKAFAVEMLRHCISSAASSLLLFSSEEKNAEQCRKEKLPDDENCRGSLVFVSQVAAAIAALHERYLLEEKIKGLRLTGSRLKSQLINEHSYVTMKADEERRKRPNYRPIVEHDGLLWQRTRNQDSSKTKTKEELLAEERDYKRRRMSYRGKKVKRSKTEVMRDIIEEHMMEIKEAGGIGCLVKGSAESGALLQESDYVHDMTAKDEFERNKCDPSEHRKQSHRYRKQLDVNYNNISRRSEDSTLKDRSTVSYDSSSSHQGRRQESHGRHEPLEDHQRGSRKERSDWEYQPRSSEAYRSRGHSNERHRHQGKHNDMEMTKTEYERSSYVSSHRSKHHESRHGSSVTRSSDLSQRKYHQMSESKDRYRGRTYGSHRSESDGESMISDRYDPSKSESRFEDVNDDESSGRKYMV